MPTEALLPCVTRSSATMILTMNDISILAFHKEEFHPCLLSVLKNDKKNAHVILYLLTYKFRPVRVKVLAYDYQCGKCHVGHATLF